jgi:EAL domain-containing protein (putative c-di-GMP-specific phosphodiesterase class I)/PleD family two-component response regulator
MATQPPVRLLIADASADRAHEIDSVLRNAGIPTRAEICVELADAITSASERPVDILLCNAGFDHLEQVLPALRERQPDLPIIVLEGTTDIGRLTKGMALGATDVVFETESQRLLYVVQRELRGVCARAKHSQTRKALKEAEQRCELLLSNATAAIAYVHEGMHIYANEDYFRAFGFDNPDDLVGVPLLDLVDPDFADEFKARIREYRGDGDQASFAFHGRTLGGVPFSGQMTLSSAEYEGEHCTQVLLKCAPSVAPVADALQDVPILTSRAEATEDVDEPDGADDASEDVETIDADSDAVPPAQPSESASASANGSTAQGASRSGYSDIAALYDAVRASGRAVGAMLVIEIDEFDALQAEHGLEAVDHVVEQIGDAIRAEAGGSLLMRISQHRFALAATGASAAGGEVMAEEIRQAVESALFEIGGRTVRRTLTVGAAAVQDVERMREAVHAAFRALVATRAAGKSNCVVWPSVATLDPDEDENGLSPEQRRILRLVSEAIEKNTFVLLFQPIISLRGDAEEHYEVFLRLLDEKGRRLAPDQFLELAIANGVAAKIDRWVILQSIKMLSTHRSKGHNTRLTINLTSNSLTDSEFVQWLGVAIKAARLPSDAVIFQIAEADVARHMRQAKEFVQGLKALHCRSSLRHFGAIENPFETLKHVPVDLVKLDGCHVQRLEGDTARRDALTEMIRKLQSMGKLTVIPMVESATVLSSLWQAGANYIQGHYLQEPSTEMNYDFSADD